MHAADGDLMLTPLLQNGIHVHHMIFFAVFKDMRRHALFTEDCGTRVWMVVFRGLCNSFNRIWSKGWTNHALHALDTVKKNLQNESYRMRVENRSMWRIAWIYHCWDQANRMV